VKTEIDRFLKVLTERDAQEDARLQALAAALDDLVAAYNRSQEVETVTPEVEVPKIDRAVFVREASATFPKLAFRYYPTVDPIEDIEQKILLSDGIDDLADIAGDLSEVLWRLENVGSEDAVWYFRFLYSAHWGRHLHNLRLYLFELLHG
jgi:hypothetical protein